jgi:glutamate racemase
VACPDFVNFVERGETSGGAVTAAAERYFQPLKKSEIDTLVLGCTHYPLLTGVISYVMGNEVTLVSSAEETAKDLYRVLVQNNLLRTQTTPATHQFISSGDPENFANLARRFLGPEVNFVKGKL